MKRILTLIAVMAVICACEKAEQQKDRTPFDLEVSYSLDGARITSLSLPSVGQTVTVDVEVNNADLYWNIKSDVDWIEILSEQHRGSGPFKMRVASNASSIDPRQGATLTFVAGAYSGNTLAVEQSGCPFILEGSVRVLTAAGQFFNTEVKVVSGTAWDFDNSGCDWVTGEKTFNRTEGNADVYDVKITLLANADASRFGNLILEDEDGNFAEMSVFQFGNEYDTDADGKIVLPSGSAASMSFKAPVGMVESVSVPSYASYTSQTEGDVETFVINVQEFLTDDPDVTDGRDVEISYVVAGSETPMQMPGIRQETTPAHAICSPTGFMKFAQAVLDEESIAFWQNDAGVVTLLNDIDFSEIEAPFQPVGDEYTSFRGIFDGQNHRLRNVVSKYPVFPYCQGATVSGVIVGNADRDNSHFDFTVDDDGEWYCSAIVGKCVDSKVLDCTNYASISVFLVTSDPAYVGGIVGKATGSLEFDNCTNFGKIAIDASKVSYSVSEFAAGSLIGYAKTLSVKGLKSNGSIDITYSTGAQFLTKYAGIGGIVGIVSGESSFSSCENNTEVTSTSYCSKSNGCYVCVGGIAGIAMNGNATFLSCCNNVNLENEHYDNDVWSKDVDCTAGILGAFEPIRSDRPAGASVPYTATISKCENSGQMTSFRGAAAGILGYGRKVKISDCTNYGNSDGYNTAVSTTQMHSYGAGIASVVIDGEISGCVATSDIKGTAAGSEICSLGGISSVLDGTCSVYNCKYYGNITKISGKGQATDLEGLIAAVAGANVTIDNCAVGGYIQKGNNAVSKVTADNVNSYVLGSGDAEVSAITFWDGK